MSFAIGNVDFDSNVDKSPGVRELPDNMTSMSAGRSMDRRLQQEEQSALARVQHQVNQITVQLSFHMQPLVTEPPLSSNTITTHLEAEEVEHLKAQTNILQQQAHDLSSCHVEPVRLRIVLPAILKRAGCMDESSQFSTPAIFQ